MPTAIVLDYRHGYFERAPKAVDRLLRRALKDPDTTHSETHKTRVVLRGVPVAFATEEVINQGDRARMASNAGVFTLQRKLGISTHFGDPAAIKVLQAIWPEREKRAEVVSHTDSLFSIPLSTNPHRELRVYVLDDDDRVMATTSASFRGSASVHVDFVQVFARYRGLGLCTTMFTALMRYISTLPDIKSVSLLNAGGERGCRCYVKGATAQGWRPLDKKHHDFGTCTRNPGSLRFFERA